ncbi:DUF4340 domain-containing protein [Leptolyngbya sp. 15MV]|nr:DUF4340 domain-containing protein [Leptolyngbya sp. 15MV]
MNAKTLVLLVATAAAASGLAVLIVQRGSPASASAESRALLFPGLEARINDVARISVRHGAKPENQFTIVRGATDWEIVERGGYPAQFEKAKQLVVGLAEMRIVETLTARPENHRRLGVHDPASHIDAPEGSGDGATIPTQVTLADEKGNPLASVILGATRWGATPMVYVRKPDDPQVWLASGRIDAPGVFTNWVDTQILNIPRDRVRSAVIMHPDGEVLAVERATPAETAFAVQNPPEGRRLRGPNVGDSVATAIAAVTLEDVAPIGSVNFDGGDGWTRGPTAEYRTFDGLVLTVQLAIKDDRTWARFVANHDASVTPPEGATGLRSGAEVAQEVDRLNARFSRFAFELPAWKA